MQLMQLNNVQKAAKLPSVLLLPKVITAASQHSRSNLRWDILIRAWSHRTGHNLKGQIQTTATAKSEQQQQPC